MKDRTFSGEDPMLVIIFVQRVKSACNTCRFHESTAKWLFEQYLIGPVEAAMKVRVTSTSSATFYHQGALKSYLAIVQFLLKSYVTDDSVAKPEMGAPNIRQSLMAPAEYTQEL